MLGPILFDGSATSIFSIKSRPSTDTALGELFLYEEVWNNELVAWDELVYIKMYIILQVQSYLSASQREESLPWPPY